jgi:hypothetical protein
MAAYITREKVKFTAESEKYFIKTDAADSFSSPLAYENVLVKLLLAVSTAPELVTAVMSTVSLYVPLAVVFEPLLSR